MVDNSTVYKIVVIAETELDQEGNICADATGTRRLHKKEVFGSVKDTFGRGYNVTGNVESSGKITGGFKGQLDADKKYAKGTWEDVYE